MERGKVPLDKMFERAFSWCISNLPVEINYQTVINEALLEQISL